MKKLLLLLLIISFSQAFAQNYKPFNSSTKKLFADFPNIQSTYSMSFDSAQTVGSDSVYFNFFRLPVDYNFVSFDCPFWGGTECWRQDMPVWIGAKIEYDNLYSYNFHPNNGDTIQFNFDLLNGGPSIFYQDSVQKFSLMYEGTDTISTLNYIDSARFFKIYHSDLEGNTINSQLNGQNIVIAKYLGLTQFFQIDSFPQVLKPLHLVGNENPNLGITKITNEMIFDYQPGDEIQYREYYYWNNGPPWENYTRYRKHSILQRTETPDFLKYVMEEQVFYQDSSLVLTDTIEKTYIRNHTIAQLPFEVFDGNYKHFYLAEYCDFELWTFHNKPENSLWYCDFDNVWGPFDTFGPPDEEYLTYALGLGVYIDKLVDYHGGISLYNGHYNNIVYFKKNGVACGELIVGVEQHKKPAWDVSVNPNPARSVVWLSADVAFTKINLIGINGKVLLSETPKSNKVSIDVGHLPDGIYFAKIELVSNAVLTKKIVVLK